MDNLMETAIKAGNFNTLVTAVKAANLLETLSGAGPFTIFAPTDDAFAKLPSGTLEELLKDIPKLTSILTYHIVQGKVTSKDVIKLTSAKTLQGEVITIDTQNGVKINNASVIIKDIEASNGVIHVIDTVILPS